jgi:hypothetical protein
MDLDWFMTEATDFFKDAEEYTTLREKFASLLPFLDMASPTLCLMWGSDWLSLTLSVLKSCMALWEWWQLRTLSRRILLWKGIIDRYGGPHITANDAKYHTFVYADAMVRIRRELTQEVSHHCHSTPPTQRH